MEMLLGSTGLVLVILVILGVSIWVSYEESLFWASVMWLCLVAVLHGIFGISLLSFVGIAGALGLLLAYVAVGGVYTAIFMWPRWLRKREDHIKRAYSEWFTKQSETATVSDFYSSHLYSEFLAANNKQRLATWTLLWFSNFIWDITHRPLIWIYENAYNSFGRLFDSVGRRVTSKILEKK
jgi:hypothetical protein